ncbi:MAG: alkaline phosphatase family protein [Ktedonobacteraceae bacterium]
MRTIIFGVDGLTFRVLHPLIERGLLPNFERLSREGCEAILESKYPSLTPPAWMSLSTGLKPSGHGVYDFWTYDDTQNASGERKVHIVTHRKSGKAIWNILSDYGKNVLVINIPTTYPPEPVNGIMISGYTTPAINSDFTYPASFKEELFKVAPDYQVDLDVAFREQLNTTGKVELLAAAVLRMTEQRIRLMMYLLKEKPWDLCYIAFMGADRLQHPYWEEVSALHPSTNAYFVMLDQALGQLLDLLAPDDSLFVVSDHGFCGHDHYFDINEYLYSKGYLVLQDADLERTRRRAYRAVQVRKLASRLGMRSVGRKIKRSLKTAGLWMFNDFAPDGLNRPVLEHIDREKTLAYVPSYSGFPGGYADIFLHPSISEEQIAEICAELESHVHPVTGKPLIDAIYKNDVYGNGPYTLREPHLLVLPREGVTFRVELGNRTLWEAIGKSFGAHHKDGVLYAWGKPFKRGFRASNAAIYDLVPTVLAAMKLPLPSTFDGRVLAELFQEEIEPAQNPLSISREPRTGIARDKLKNLLVD